MRETAQSPGGPRPERAGARPADAVRERFARERKEATRRSIAPAGAVAVVAMPAWTLFDYHFHNETTVEFIAIRLVATVVIAGFLTMLDTGFGRRRPEVIGLG